jgi:hypothetical protein
LQQLWGPVDPAGQPAERRAAVSSRHHTRRGGPGTRSSPRFMRRGVDAKILGEFPSGILATTMVVYSDCVERESVSDGRIKRDVVPLRDVGGVRIEAVRGSPLVHLVIDRETNGHSLKIELMERSQAERAKSLLDALADGAASPP